MIRYSTRLPTNSGLTLVSDLVVRKTSQYYSIIARNYIRDVVHYFEKNPCSYVVKAWNYKELPINKSNHYTYSYDMERLGLISSEEKNIIAIIVKYENVSLSSYPQYWSSHPSLMGFLQTVIEDGKYDDLHDGNVMIDTQENYRLIDLEGFIKYPLDTFKNDWLRGK